MTTEQPDPEDRTNPQNQPVGAEDDGDREAGCEPTAEKDRGDGDVPPSGRRPPGGRRLSEQERRTLEAVRRHASKGLFKDAERLQAQLRYLTGVDRAAAQLQRLVETPGGVEEVRRLTGAERVTAQFVRLVETPGALEQLRRLTGAERVTAQFVRLVETPGALEQLRRLTGVDRVMEIAQQLSRAALPNGAHILADQLKALDSWTPPGLRPLQLSATAALVGLAYRGTPLETWRRALIANAEVGHLANIPRLAVSRGLLNELAARTQVTTDLAQRLAEASPALALPSEMTRSVRAWQRYVGHGTTEHQLRMATAASTTVGGLVAGNLLDQPDQPATDEVVLDVETRIIEPWRSGPQAAQSDLYAVLATVDADVVTFLKGAWDDVEHAGAAAASKIAHCVVEAIDHTLRALAPDNAAVYQWLHRDGRKPSKDEVHEGKPTRRGRVAYAMRNRPGDRPMVQALEAAVSSLVGKVQDRAQGMKHAPGAATVVEARMLLSTGEALLMLLVLG